MKETTHKDALIAEVLGSVNDIEKSILSVNTSIDSFKTEIKAVTEETLSKTLNMAENICNAAIVAAKIAIDNQVDANTRKTVETINAEIKKFQHVESSLLKRIEIALYINSAFFAALVIEMVLKIF